MSKRHWVASDAYASVLPLATTLSQTITNSDAPAPGSVNTPPSPSGIVIDRVVGTILVYPTGFNLIPSTGVIQRVWVGVVVCNLDSRTGLFNVPDPSLVADQAVDWIWKDEGVIFLPSLGDPGICTSLRFRLPGRVSISLATGEALLWSMTTDGPGPLDVSDNLRCRVSRLLYS